MTALTDRSSSAIESGWQPIELRQRDEVGTRSVARLHGLLDAQGRPPESEDPVPPLWHWLAFLPEEAQSALGADGHPMRGSFFPPVRLPLRMFVGGRVEFHAMPRIGAPLERRGVVTSVTEKAGRSGRLVFVTVQYKLYEGARLIITEEQDLVYRERPTGSRGSASAPAPGAEEVGPDWAGWTCGWDLPIDERLLFRFSALTYNAHRIHYDRLYAVETEGYPGLVVHGPLQAIALAELCRSQATGGVCRFTFRSVAPAFEGAPLLLRGQHRDGVMTLAAFSAGRRTTSARALLDD